MDDPQTQKIELPSVPAIMFGNQKGGVGKSTNTVNIASALGHLGYRVLVIDTDGEASATRSLGVTPEEFAGFYEICLGINTAAQTVVSEGLPPNVDLIPSRNDVNVVPERIDTRDRSVTYGLLRETLAWARDNYDLVLIDTPPTAGAFQAISAYANATHLVLSVKGDSYSYEAMHKAVSQMVLPIREQANPSLTILGILVCDVSIQSQDWFRDIWIPMAAYGDEKLMFTRRIRRHALVTAGQREGRTVFQMANRHWVKNRGIIADFTAVAKEIIVRLSQPEAFAEGRLEGGPPLPDGWQKQLDRYIDARLEQETTGAEA
ncbi:MAG: ParA family protein [Planctomycetota bacterium]